VLTGGRPGGQLFAAGGDGDRMPFPAGRAGWPHRASDRGCGVGAAGAGFGGDGGGQPWR